MERHRQTKEAIEDVLAAEADRARGNAVRENEPLTGEDDPSIVPLWQIVLSPLRKVGAKDRLDAFAALDQLELLPRCTCKARPEHELVEHKTDAWRAYTIRLVAQKHLRAAYHVAWYPQTYLAVRDAIDAEIAEQVRAADETARRRRH